MTRGLSTSMYGQINRDTLELLFKLYEGIVAERERVPDIDYLYGMFRERWIDDTYSFLTTNADIYEIDLKEINKWNLTIKLEEWGFAVPTFQDIHDVLNLFQYSYLNNGVLVNSTVVEVW